MTDDSQRNALLAMQSQVADVAAALSGIKQQFIEAGWSPEVSEWIVLHMLQGQKKEESDD